MIDPAELTVVLQGALPAGAAARRALDDRIGTLRRVLPRARVVVSSWESARALPKTAADQTIYSPDPGSLPPYKLGACKPNNVNRQIVSSAAGLAEVRTPFAMKLRIDAALVHGGALSALAAQADGPAGGRIVTVGHFSLNPRLFERLPFHFSDWFQLGPTSHLRALWSCPLMSASEATHYDSHAWAAHSNHFEQRFRARWPAEQHVWRHYAAQRGYRVPDFHNDNAPAVLAAHDRFFAQELLLLDLPQAGVHLPALAWAARSGMQRFNCLNHTDWLAAASQFGPCPAADAQALQIQRRRQAQRWVQRGFQAALPMLPLLARPPLKIACRWLLKSADAWARPAAPATGAASHPVPELAPSLNATTQTPCSTS
jgi:WavE lipopolysaccharide synthesis